MASLNVSIYRFDPEKDEVPYMQDTRIELPEGRDPMVLHVLEDLKAQDPTLTFRRSCREGVCGSDGINMNGQNGLACITPISEAAPKGKLVLRPLPGLRHRLPARSAARLRGGRTGRVLQS